MQYLTRLSFSTATLLALAISSISASGLANGNRHSSQEETALYLFTNVNVWDGTAESLTTGVQVLVEGNLIKQVGKELNAKGAMEIDGQGKTLMPGLIDMHSHLCFQNGMLDGRGDFDQMAMGAMAAHDMVGYLDQGFTTARDAGGNILGLAKAVNAGRIPGPRLFPAGAFLSQTGGHADTGFFNDPLHAVDPLEYHGVGYVVDGVPEVLKAARINLRAGATHIKIMAGGGVASEFDPIHTTQFTLEEMKAAVKVAADYGTYVMAHAYHDRSVNRCMDAGVKVIEHNFLVSEKTIKRMKAEGVALSCQAVMSVVAFANPESITFFNKDQKEKAFSVYKGAKQMFEWANKHDLLIVSGGDMFGPAYTGIQADNITAMVDLAGFSEYKALKSATSNAATVLGWSGGMNPYKAGPLGVIQEGAYADVIIVDGNPLEDIHMLERDHVRFVMKDGRVYKDNLASGIIEASHKR